MRVISKQRNRIIERILSHPFLKEMDFQAKLILLLGSFTLLLIAADLSSEMSKDKDETGFFTACLENLDDAGTNHADLINHDIPIFANVKTWCAMKDKLGDIKDSNMKVFENDRSYSLGDLIIRPFSNKVFSDSNWL